MKYTPNVMTNCNWNNKVLDFELVISKQTHCLECLYSGVFVVLVNKRIVNIRVIILNEIGVTLYLTLNLSWHAHFLKYIAFKLSNNI